MRAIRSCNRNLLGGKRSPVFFQDAQVCGSKAERSVLDAAKGSVCFRREATEEQRAAPQSLNLLRFIHSYDVKCASKVKVMQSDC